MLHGLGTEDVGRAVNVANQDFAANEFPNGSYSQPGTSIPYERMAVAYAVIFCGRGVPFIYYGDEIGLAGGIRPDNAKLMTFNSLSSAQRNLNNKICVLAAIRRNNPVLTFGRRSTISFGVNTWIFSITGSSPGDSIIVALNRGDTDETISIPAGTYTNLSTGGIINGGGLSLAARSYLILR